MPSSNTANLHYELHTRFHGHLNAITVMAVSADGLLASGGYDEVKLWEVPGAVPVATPFQGPGLHGPTSAMIWLDFSGCPSYLLVFGTGIGVVVAWQHDRQDGEPIAFRQTFSRRLGDGAEITGFTSAEFGQQKRLALAARDGLIQLWAVDAAGNMNNLFSVRLDGLVPRGIAFTTGNHLCIFSMFGGDVFTLNGDDGAVVRALNMGRLVIGNVTIDSVRQCFAIDNACSGFELFSLSEMYHIRSYSVGKPTVRFPKQVVFGEHGRVIVGGSDTGRIFIFDRESGAMLDALKHADGGLVQSVVAYTGADSHFIIAAGSTPGSMSEISVWARPVDLPREPGAENLNSSRNVHLTDAFVRFLAVYVFLVIGAATQLVRTENALTTFACYAFILVISVIFLLKVFNKDHAVVEGVRTFLRSYIAKACRLRGGLHTQAPDSCQVE